MLVVHFFIFTVVQKTMPTHDNFPWEKLSVGCIRLEVPQGVWLLEQWKTAEKTHRWKNTGMGHDIIRLIWVIKKERSMFQLNYMKMRGQKLWRKIKQAAAALSSIGVAKCLGTARKAEQLLVKRYSVQVGQASLHSPRYLLLTCWMMLEMSLTLMFRVLLQCLIKHIFVGLKDAAILFLCNRQIEMGSSHSEKSTTNPITRTCSLGSN